MAIADIVQKFVPDITKNAGKILIVDEHSSSFGYFGIAEAGALKSEAKWAVFRIYRQGNVYTIEQAPSENYDNIWDDRASLFASMALNNSYSVSFDGVNDFVTCGNNYTFGPSTAFSVSFWCKPNNLAATRCLISKCSNDAFVAGWNIQHLITTGKIQIQMRNTVGSGPVFAFTSALTAGVWQHVVLTYSGNANINGNRCYVDDVIGDIPGSSAITGAFTNTAEFVIGARNTAFPFSGFIDEVCVFDKELSHSEVTELYNSGQPYDMTNFSAYNNLLSWWRMGDDDTFPIILDNRSTANGTMTNQIASDISGDVP